MRQAVRYPATVAWTGVALAALGAAALYAVVLVLLRSPLALWVPGVDVVFRVSLVVHVQLAFVFWMLAFAASRWALPTQTVALAVVGSGGVVLVAVSPWLSRNPARETLLVNYLPATAEPAFVAGGVALLGAVLAVALTFLAQPARQRRAQDPSGWLLAAALAFIAALAVFWLPLDGRGWQARAWAGGHVLQFCYVALAVDGVWQMLGRPASAWLRLTAAGWIGALLLAVLWSTVASDLSPAFYTRLMQWWLWPLPLCVIAAQFAASAWRTPQGIVARVRVVPILSLFLAGCVLGALVRADSLLVPAHYHAVLGALTAVGLAQLAVGEQPAGGAAQSMFRWVMYYVVGKFVLVAGLTMLALSGGRRKAPLDTLLAGDGWLLPGVAAVVLGGGLAVLSVLGFVGAHFLRYRSPQRVVNGEVEHG